MQHKTPLHVLSETTDIKLEVETRCYTYQTDQKSLQLEKCLQDCLFSVVSLRLKLISSSFILQYTLQDPSFNRSALPG